MVERLLKYCNMTKCKSAETPLQARLKLSVDESEVLSHRTPYRQLIGSLLHLSNTVRPDISFAVGYLSRFVHQPTEELYRAAKHVLRYLRELRYEEYCSRLRGSVRYAFSPMLTGDMRNRRGNRFLESF